MSPQDHPRRYDVSGNIEAQYVDESQAVLVNSLGITDLEALQREEEQGLIEAYQTLIGEVQTDTPLTCELIQRAHRLIFGKLFDWAGRWRTVQISKPGAIWPTAQYLDQSMQHFERLVLRKHPASTLTNDDDFCRAVGEIQGEFLAIHPFREGNARTIKLVTNLLAAQTGRPFLTYDETPTGSQRYIAAGSAALLRKDYLLMTQMAREALDRARSRSTT